MLHVVVLEHTRSSNVNVHAVVLYLSLRRSRGNGGNAQVCGIQVLLGPFPVVSVITEIQHGLLFKLDDYKQKGVWLYFRLRSNILQQRGGWDGQHGYVKLDQNVSYSKAVAVWILVAPFVLIVIHKVDVRYLHWPD